MGEHWVSWENMKNMENAENMEKMENVNQMTWNTLFMIQNTLHIYDSKHSICDSKLFLSTRWLKTLYFMAFMATVEKIITYA